MPTTVTMAICLTFSGSVSILRLTSSSTILAAELRRLAKEIALKSSQSNEV